VTGQHPDEAESEPEYRARMKRLREDWDKKYRY